MLRARLFTGVRVWQQAELMWVVLTGFVMFPENKAKKIRTMTYGELARHMGYDSPSAGHTLGRPLGLIGSVCLASNLPPLNAVVVSKFGQPGEEVVLRPGSTVEKDQTAVCETNWFGWRAPRSAVFRSIWESRGQDAS